MAGLSKWAKTPEVPVPSRGARTGGRVALPKPERAISTRLERQAFGDRLDALEKAKSATAQAKGIENMVGHTDEKIRLNQIAKDAHNEAARHSIGREQREHLDAADKHQKAIYDLKKGGRTRAPDPTPKAAEDSASKFAVTGAAWAASKAARTTDNDPKQSQAEKIRKHQEAYVAHEEAARVTSGYQQKKHWEDATRHDDRVNELKGGGEQPRVPAVRSHGGEFAKK